MDVVVSKIAHGVPIGVDMEYIDTLTLEMALEDRKNVT
jgi:recombinational DNA repair protein RecR